MKVRAIVHRAEEGGYWAEVPAMPGCVTQGENIDEIKRNLKDAIEGWLMAGEQSLTGSQDLIWTKGDSPISAPDESYSVRKT